VEQLGRLHQQDLAESLRLSAGADPVKVYAVRKEEVMAKPTRKRTQNQECPSHAPAEASAPRWFPHLDYYPEQSVLQFPSDTDLEAAIALLWSDGLRTLPHDTAGRKTLVIPTEAVPYFTQAGLRFTVKRLRHMSELSPEELKTLRR
jgi:hypothetical protein